LQREAEIPVTSVGTDPKCEVVVSYGEDSLSGSDFVITVAGKRLEVRTPLAGRFNVANAAIALTCAHLQGVDLSDAVGRLERMTPIAGRYNALATDLGIWVIVDYAHTADAIAGVIAETRSLTTGRIIAVAGAGGDRDTEKRPSMGRALAEADVAIVTTDNPRSEDPELIAQQVLSGIEDQSDVVLELDRRMAIRRALATSAGGDVVLILGKGHETIQEFADGEVHFDDSEVAEEELARLSGRLT
jgi:UDP-N-acetylmuramoyl-L-alanyl-D-glutamate--2,6-diaminopimelate ligase